MKTKLKRLALAVLTAALALFGAGNVTASPKDDLPNTCRYFLRNAKTGQYFAQGGNWGTQAFSKPHGQGVNLEWQGDNLCYIDTHVQGSGDSHYLSSASGYCDNRAEKLRVTPNGDAYLISDAYSTDFLTSDAADSAITFTDRSEGAASQDWFIESEGDLAKGLEAATPDSPKDATFLIRDPDISRECSDFSAWMGEKRPKTDGPSDMSFREDQNAQYAGATTFDFYQTSGNMPVKIPNGVYVLKARAFYRPNSGDYSTQGDVSKYPVLYANEASVPFAWIGRDAKSVTIGIDVAELGGKVPSNQPDATAAFKAGLYGIEVKVEVTDGNLRFGVKMNDPGADSGNWVVFDKFELYYYGLAQTKAFAESAEGTLDLTAGDRVAEAEEALVVDPTWGDVTEATVEIDGEEQKRTYTAASIDTWQTESLEPGRYSLAFTAGELKYSAAFWKTGTDWTVLNGEDFTENTELPGNTTYLILGTNTIADGVKLTVGRGATFNYDEGAPAGFKLVGSGVIDAKAYEISEVDGLVRLTPKASGHMDNPWTVGAGSDPNALTAYTNGTEFVVQGEGEIAKLADAIEGWNDFADGLAAITITDPTITGAEADAFAGIGGGEPLALTLPDGWQGDLPDESCNWYGANVTLTAMPRTVRNVAFAQRYPWNGKVDITFDLTGAAGETNIVVSAYENGTDKLADFTTTVTIPDDGVLSAKLVWDLADAGLAANFKSENVTVEVAFKGETGLTCVQLWADGPYWTETNLGESEVDDHPEYGSLYKFDDAGSVVKSLLGQGWRVPSQDDFNKLVDTSYCKRKWDDTRKGHTFTGNTEGYKDKSIFLPAAGNEVAHVRDWVGYDGLYWSSEAVGDSVACYLHFNEDGAYVLEEGRSSGMSVRAVRDTPAPAPTPTVAARSAAGTLDLRKEVALDEGETTVSNVTWSATAWGTQPETFTTVGYTNLTTGATGVFGNLLNILGEGAKDAVLPKKDGVYRLTHTTGDLTSLATFEVSGYPLGCESNPWLVGAGEDPAEVTAVSNGVGEVCFTPVRGTVTRAGLMQIRAAMGGDDYPAFLVPEGGAEPQPLQMLLADGVAYDTIGEAMDSAADAFQLFEVKGYWVSYDGAGAAGEMANDKFIPSVPTNLTANAYTAVGYEFLGWMTNGCDEVAYADRAAGTDFAEPGETLALTAKWNDTGVTVTTFDALMGALQAAPFQADSLPVTITLANDVTVPQGAVVKVYDSPAVTFTGAGRLDVSGLEVQYGSPVVVGEGFADASLFDGGDKVEPRFEGGNVYAHARGETEGFPWLVGPEGAEADTIMWLADGALYTKPVRGTASVAALEAVTNLNGGVTGPVVTFLADGTPANVVMFLGDDGVPYDTLVDVLSADPRPKTVKLFEVKSYWVSYAGGEGAAGEMATDMFIPSVPTNLAANAFEIVGWGFAGWTTNGVDVAYADRAAGVDFAEPGETLALTALWEQVETKPATYAELVDMLARVTRPVVFTLDGDIELPADGLIAVAADKDVTFVGEGRFVAADTIPAYGQPETVGTGLKPEDFERFVTDGDVKAYFEDGDVVLHARGESEEFPWEAGEGVTAYVDEALTNLAAVVIDAGDLALARAIDLAALTNGMAKSAYKPALEPFNALMKAGENEFLKPVNWLDAGDATQTYATLEDALAAGVAAVVPNFITEEIPAEIVETGKGADGVTYKAVVENAPGEVEDPVKAIAVDGLLDLATNEQNDVTFLVEAMAEGDVAPDEAAELAAANTNGLVDVVGYAADYVDLSAYYGDERQTELGKVVAIHLPWNVNPRQAYRVSRVHEGAVQPLPVGEENAVDGEYVEILEDEIVIHAKLFSLYAIGEIELQPRYTVVVGDGEKMLGEPDPSCMATNFTVNVQGLDIQPGDIQGYCVRAKGEAAGDYAINFICTRKPQGFDGEFVVVPGTFTIVMGGMLPGDGTVTAPKAANGSEYLKPNASATWKAKPDSCSVFVRWTAAEGAPETVTNLLASAGDKVFKTSITLKVPAGAQVKPENVIAVWKRLDQDVPAGQVAVMLRCDETMGNVTGSKLYKLNARTGSAKASISAKAKTDYVFAGWYEDPGFSMPAALPKDYRETAQTVTVTTNTYLFARFVEKTTKADPITHLRFNGAGYCGADASEFAEDETWYQGVALPTNGCQIAFGSASLPTVKVSGLPSGVKFDKKTLRFTGVPTAASTEKKPFFTVKVTVKNKSGATDVLTKYVWVEALPAWAVGNFDGFHMAGGATNGTFTATVGQKGKVSGKTAGGLAATTFSAASFDDVFVSEGGDRVYSVGVKVSYRDSGVKKVVNRVDTLYLMEDRKTGLGVIGGGDADGCGCIGVQRAWGRKDLAFPAFSTGNNAPTLGLGNGLTLKFGANGKVAFSGKVTGSDGSPVSVSGSTYVLPTAWTDENRTGLLAQVYVYAAPRKNLASGVSEVHEVLLTVGVSGMFDKAVAVPDVEQPAL